MRIAALENRNKALAAMLGDALNELRSQTENGNISNSNATLQAIDVALAKIQFVQVYLEDSSVPIPVEEKTDSRKAEATCDEPTSTISGSNSSAKVQDSSSPIVPNPSGGNQNSQNPRSFKNSLSETSVIQAIDLAKPVSVLPTARPPLAESSFSWILGDTRHRSSFVTSASPPPEQRRNTESRGRPSILFGDDPGDENKRNTGVEDDALALSSLHVNPGQ
jgi:TBC1 domain family protein 5